MNRVAPSDPGSDLKKEKTHDVSVQDEKKRHPSSLKRKEKGTRLTRRAHNPTDAEQRDDARRDATDTDTTPHTTRLTLGAAGRRTARRQTTRDDRRCV